MSENSTDSGVVIQYCVMRRATGEVRTKCFVVSTAHEERTNWDSFRETDEKIVLKGEFTKRDFPDKRDASFFDLFAQQVAYVGDTIDPRAAMNSFFSELLGKAIADTVHSLEIRGAMPLMPAGSQQ